MRVFLVRRVSSLVVFGGGLSGGRCLFSPSVFLWRLTLLTDESGGFCCGGFRRL